MTGQSTFSLWVPAWSLCEQATYIYFSLTITCPLGEFWCYSSTRCATARRKGRQWKLVTGKILQHTFDPTITNIYQLHSILKCSLEASEGLLRAREAVLLQGNWGGMGARDRYISKISSNKDQTVIMGCCFEIASQSIGAWILHGLGP